MASHPTNSMSDSNESPQPLTSAMPAEILSETAFQRLICLERKRSERSKRRFVLLLIDIGGSRPNGKNGRVLVNILTTLRTATRETDFTGWYKTDSVVGVMFTEIVLENSLVLSMILERISSVVRDRLDTEEFSRIKFSFHVFPDEWDTQSPEGPIDSTLYPDLKDREQTNRTGRVTKRMIDIVGSVTLMILLLPVFLIIAAVVKLTSRGPVLFRQKRIGQHGAPFTFLKFRSMYVGNDSGQHKEYVRALITGRAERQPVNGNSNGTGVFKLTNDPRITPVGRFLRRSSLDELPQLINVLRGDMSLVGPRPAVPYEVEAYATWHRRRVLEAKPGITGLWQVYGRCRVGFEDMVRLDLRYARECSPWLDLKILLQTPRAVIGGEGAY